MHLLVSTRDGGRGDGRGDIKLTSSEWKLFTTATKLLVMAVSGLLYGRCSSRSAISVRDNRGFSETSILALEPYPFSSHWPPAVVFEDKVA